MPAVHPATAKIRMMGVRHFTRWLADEGEIVADPFLRMKAPKVDQPVVPVLTEDQLRALIKACQPREPRSATGYRRCVTAATRPSCGSCSRPG